MTEVIRRMGTGKVMALAALAIALAVTAVFLSLSATTQPAEAISGNLHVYGLSADLGLNQDFMFIGAGTTDSFCSGGSSVGTYVQRIIGFGDGSGRESFVAVANLQTIGSQFTVVSTASQCTDSTYGTIIDATTNAI